jgi:tetratricopeptide (TPR) repeat protein
MVRFSIGPLLLILLSAPAFAQPAKPAQTEQDFARLFDRALELQQAGDLLGAVENYKAALAVSPDRADALSNLGAAYVRLGQYDDGIKQYDAAL